MTLFDRLYAATEEATKVLKKPFVQNKVKRAFDGAVDGYESQKIDQQEIVDALVARLANGETDVLSDLIEARLVLVEIDLQTAEAKKARDELFATVKE